MAKWQSLILLLLLEILNKTWATDLSVCFDRSQPNNRGALHFRATEQITGHTVAIDPVHLPENLLNRYQPVQAQLLTCYEHGAHHLLVRLQDGASLKNYRYILYMLMLIPMFNYESFTILAYDTVKNVETGNGDILYITLESADETKRNSFIKKDILGKKGISYIRFPYHDEVLPPIKPQIHRHARSRHSPSLHHPFYSQNWRYRQHPHNF